MSSLLNNQMSVNKWVYDSSFTCQYGECTYKTSHSQRKH